MDITVNADSIWFRVRVQPRASRGALVEGCANESLRRFLAERLNVSLSAVRIVSGENSRNKRVAVAGITREQVLALC
jgi:hypothetical protein